MKNENANDFRIMLATASDEVLDAFIERNELQDILSYNKCNIWIRGEKYGHMMGATRCHKINTSNNKVRGNWFIHRA